MFVTHNKVRMHDTDMAGVLYFARQFRFAHDALEDFAEREGISFNDVFHGEHFVFVIVHAEADYLMSLQIGDPLEIEMTIENVGSSSFTIFYKIFRNKKEKELVGTVKTVHVTLDSKSRKKIPIPAHFKKILKKYEIEKV